MSHQCPFCPYRTTRENEYDAHERLCISTWKHKLGDQSIPVTTEVLARALTSCLCMIEQQNTNIRTLRMELSRAKPYINKRQKKHHETILKSVQCTQDIYTWLRGITFRISLPDLLENGIKYTAHMILKQYIEKWEIPHIEVEPTEMITTECPLFIFQENQNRIYVFMNDNNSKGEKKWVVMTDEFMTSIISFIYSNISNNCLTLLNQTNDALEHTIAVMEILNRDPPHKSLQSHRQFLCHCLLRQMSQIPNE